MDEVGLIVVPLVGSKFINNVLCRNKIKPVCATITHGMGKRVRIYADRHDNVDINSISHQSAHQSPDQMDNPWTLEQEQRDPLFLILKDVLTNNHTIS